MSKTIELEIANENFEQGGYFYTDILLPAKDYEIKEAYQRARTPYQNGYCEITLNECPLLPELEHMRLDAPTMEEMNFLAKRLAALSEDERIVLRAVKAKVFNGKEDTLIIECEISRDDGNSFFDYIPTRAEANLIKEMIAEKIQQVHAQTPQEFCESYYGEQTMGEQQ